MSDNRAYDPDEYFGRAGGDPDVPDLKAEAAERLRQAVAYARLHAPELLEEWPGAARTHRAGQTRERPIIRRDSPDDLVVLYANTHTFKAERLDEIHLTNCDLCGEQYGARYVRLCPARISR